MRHIYDICSAVFKNNLRGNWSVSADVTSCWTLASEVTGERCFWGDNTINQAQRNKSHSKWTGMYPCYILDVLLMNKL